MNNTNEEYSTDKIDIELLVVMIGVAINLLVNIYTIYSQTNHTVKCQKSLCCDNFEFSDTSDPI